MIWIGLAVVVLVLAFLLLMIWKSRDPHALARVGKTDRLARLLDNNPAALHKRAKSGELPLHHAAKYGEVGCVSLLLDRGSDVNAVSNEGVTSLHYAAAFGETKTVKLLLARGASPDPLESTGISPLIDAKLRGFSEIVALLTSAGADPNREPTVIMQDPSRGVVALASDDPLLTAARTQAKATLPEFFRLQKVDPANCSIKFPLQTPDGVEHVWGIPVTVSDAQLSVHLMSKPISEMNLPRAIPVQIAEIEDWQVIQPDNRIRGAFTMIATFHRLIERHGRLPESFAKDVSRFVDYTPHSSS